MTTFERQAALAGEHAAVYAYGVAGAGMSGTARRRALGLLDAHRESRDALAAALRGDGEVPVAALPGYAVEAPVRRPADAARLLRDVEQRLADVYGDLVEAAEGPARRTAATALARAAERAAVWGGRTDAFPGYVLPPA